MAYTEEMPFDADAGNVHVPAAATPAVLTFTAVAGKRHVIKRILSSYSATPAGGRLTITDAGVTVLDLDIPAAGPQEFLPNVRGGVNAEVVVTLASGGGTVVGKLNVYKRTKGEL